MKKQFLNYAGQTFEQIKSEANIISHFASFEDFNFVYGNSVLDLMASNKLKLFGFYSFTTSKTETVFVGKKKQTVVRQIKSLIVLKNGRTHKLVGTKLVSI